MIGFFFKFVDAVFGFAFIIFTGAAVAGLFALGGGPKKYELDALGAAYSNALQTVEDAAHDLRGTYCEKADAEAQREARCVQPAV